MACEFCKFYEFNKKSASDFMKKYTDIDMEMKASLTIDYSRGKERGKERGNITTGESFNLIFCPMCGKKLSETKLNEVPTDVEVKLVNRIIREAIIHGADSGGSYESNEYDLINSVNEWLKIKGLFNTYEIKDSIDVGDGWHLHQIVRRE